DRVVRIFETAVGAPISPSPTGTFKIITAVPNPTWYTKGRTVPSGPANPLGTRWLGLSQKGFGIHGTNVPSSIGKAASHGCIRMRQRDLEELFAMVQVGDQVMFRDVQLTALLTPLQPSDEQPTLALNNANANATAAIIATD